MTDAEIAEREEWERWVVQTERDGRVVVDQITRAFDGVERGDGVSLHEADVIDNYGSLGQRLEARLLDTDTRWQDVPDADIERFHWILSFLDAKGFHYYAPAYMVWTVRNIATSDSMSTDSTIYSLVLPNNPTMREHNLKKWSLFGIAQRRAICVFLRFMVRCYERADANQAEAALQNYWGQFCEPEAVK